MAAAVDDKDLKRCCRLLNYYTEGSVYKVLGRTYNKENAACLVHMLEEKRGKEILAEVEKYNDNCTPVQKDMLLFTVALCMKSKDSELKQHANKIFLLLCKTAKELFTFIQFHKKLSGDTNSRGYGRSLRRTLNEWYNRQDPMDLAILVMKESASGGWSHANVLRLAHIKGKSEGTAIILKYLVKGMEELKKLGEQPENVQKVVDYLKTIHSVRNSTDEHQVARLIEQHHLGKQQVLPALLNSKEIWGALVSEMSVGEVLENFNKLASVGFLEIAHDGSKKIVEMLRSEEILQKSNIQPIDVVMALSAYEHGKAGKVTWMRNEAVIDALNFALESTMKVNESNNTKSTNKRYLIGVRVGSNTKKSTVRGTQSLPSLVAASAIAMITARKEDKVQLVYFADKATELTLTSESSLKEISEEISKQILVSAALPPVGSGDTPKQPCDLAAPIRWATENSKKIDVFINITDSLDRTGDITPSKALMQYRKEMNMPKAKLVSCGLCNANMKTADPNDPRMIDIAGFDATVPIIINKFILDEC
ncbi:RNA-binding protein RO60-like [Mytilus edulis]|uniref:RNA-binding protein RO60-like n=1 Tax=Mytilus edulis TaxID=6550 RepID=UPI0039F0B712